MCLLTAISES